ncbi:MAG: PilT/PilU family type 4a pilus ATPase [Deltaproteobacteria bacterium]|nr:PilT/PilU family type 4a pilus ATPase [Deltaproteobacteria bacterium]
MDLATFNQFLGAAVNSGASDIHFKAGVTPAVRVNGELRPVRVPALRPEDTMAIARHILTAARWQGDAQKLQEVDTSYPLENVGRFRASVFRQMGHLAVIMRAIPANVPTFDQLGLPAVVKKIAEEDRGLILVTGVTGSGKTSTLAAFVNHMNQTTRRHILTIEDPVEYIHQDNFARVTQREIGPDTHRFASAQRSALRQDPDVILVGEMRDLETIDIALKAAETGHLVLSTAHTIDASRTIGRIVGAYPSDAQPGVRNRLSETLKATMSQRLLPRADGRGRVVAAEILINTLSVQECIRDADRISEIKDLLEKGHDVYGTQSFDQHLSWLLQQGAVTMEAATEAATNSADFERAVALG